MNDGFVVGCKSRRIKGGLFLIRLVVFTVLLTGSLWSDVPASGVPASGVKLFPAELPDQYPDAIEKGTIQYACSSDRAALARFFAERSLPLDAGLIRPMQGYSSCHVFYEPTLPGFRASADDEEIRGLFAVPDPLAFLVNPKPVGQSYDVIRDVLSRVERPLDVRLGLALDFGSELWPEADELPFRDTIHRVGYVDIPSGQDSPWVQDYFKAGRAGGRLKVMVPRRLFEGRSDSSAQYSELLNSFEGEPYFRSKLSWEGGDLQFVLSPQDPSSLLVFYGESTVDYWGESLPKGDLAYVLRMEFGADRVVDMSGIGPHTDYLVAFLTATNTALVSQPVLRNQQVALAAAREIKLLHPGRTPGELLDLIGFFETQLNGLAENPQYVLRQLELLWPRFEAMDLPGNEALQNDLESYVERHCPSDPAACLSIEGQKQMLRTTPDLLRRLLEEGNDAHIKKTTPSKLLDLIAAQLPGELSRQSIMLDEKAAEIEKLGFRVIRVPYLYTGNLVDQWAGISHVNLVAQGRKLFVPTFGLGDVETRLLQNLQKKLKQDYEVIPVYARFSLLLNGGVHCLFGITRGNEPTPLPRLTQLRRRQAVTPVMPEAQPVRVVKTPAA